MAETMRSFLDKMTLKFAIIIFGIMFSIISWGAGFLFYEGLAYLKRIDTRFETLAREYSLEFNALKMSEATSAVRLQQIDEDVKEIKSRLNDLERR